MLSAIELSNVRVFRKQSVPLGQRLTILTGRNNSGKSTVLDALRHANIAARARSEPGGRSANEALRPNGFEGIAEIAVCGQGDLRLVCEVADSPGASRLRAEVAGQEVVETPYGVPLPWFDASSGALGGLVRDVTSLFHYRIAANYVAHATEEDDYDRVPRLSHLGGNTAAVLQALSVLEPELYAELGFELSSAIEGFADLHFRTLTQGVQFGVRFDDSRDVVWASDLSDGTRSLIALAAITSHPVAPNVTAIEEPENGLSPHSLRHVAKWLDTYSTRSQVVFATHSPFLLRDILDLVPDATTYVVRQENGIGEVYPMFPADGRGTPMSLDRIVGLMDEM